MSLPAGTITCVFTDIEASTALLKQLGDRYGDLLRAHRSIVRDTFSPAGGVEIDTQGDSFFFAFPRARDAVAAAIEVQRAHARTAWPGEAVVDAHQASPSLCEMLGMNAHPLVEEREQQIMLGLRVILAFPGDRLGRHDTSVTHETDGYA
jgi:class 3 adenylate cyclase